MKFDEISIVYKEHFWKKRNKIEIGIMAQWKEGRISQPSINLNNIVFLYYLLDKNQKKYQ